MIRVCSLGWKAADALSESIYLTAGDELLWLGEDRRAAVDAARRLVAIGHSSGWDMLAGFVAAFPARM